ncbi:protein phosphatase 2A 55 kDa regulatory subunit B alpha isoform [Striga asiatica]|uniref:Protein phosphatase 2A 55 kDa regulatory subunit B alpha isoform n=1 Tax=Striga asiatica TaxID=4170 RepID=A0A5A7RHC2_STRAF|nr:protein phosphatase 2A 55 kDa regulatory subunit B alpha isoform [Striga asiatica]
MNSDRSSFVQTYCMNSRGGVRPIAQCTARAAPEAGAIAAAGADCTTVAKADPTLPPRWYFFNGVCTKAEADFPRPSLMLWQRDQFCSSSTNSKQGLNGRKAF